MSILLQDVNYLILHARISCDFPSVNLTLPRFRSMPYRSQLILESLACAILHLTQDRRLKNSVED